MRLTRLRLLRTPGIRDPFTLEPSPGINLVTGPNGVGKSSVIRAVLSLLWPNMIHQEPFEAEAEFEIGTEHLRVSRRDLEQPQWEGGSRPNLGSDHLAGRYQLGVLDLLVPDPGGDLLAKEVRNQMAGGFDLGNLRESLFPARNGRSEKSDLKIAGALVARLKNEQQSLAIEQDRLIELKAERDLAGEARNRLAALENLHDLINQKSALKNAVARLEDLPGACASVRPEDPDKLNDLRGQERGHLGEIEHRTASLATISRELNLLKSSGGLDTDLPVGLLRKKLEVLIELRRDLRQAERDSGGQHLDDVLAEASLKPSLMPAVLMLACGAALITAGLLVPVPGPVLPWVVVALGGGVGGAGVWGLFSYSRGAGQARVALEKKQELAGKIDHQARCRGQLNDALVDFNATLAVAGLDSVGDPDEAAHLLDDLAGRRERSTTLKSDQRNHAEFLERERIDLERVMVDIEAILGRLGLDDHPGADAEASRLLDLRPPFEQAVRDRDAAAGEVDRLSKHLAESASLLRQDENPEMPPGNLNNLIEIEMKRAGEYGNLMGEIARIEAEVKNALGGHDLQEALAAEVAAATTLADVRQANREAALGQLLLDRVQWQHEKETRPLVLDRADEYFSLFTGGLYSLKLAARSNGEDRFLAVVEDSVRPLELEELSDGTRAQLLLAVKLAFMTEGEEGARPPIFLDDSLTLADPVRFAAVAAGLGRLAEEENRQVFYLTPNPADAAAFKRALGAAGLVPPHHLDLAAKRGVEGTVDPALLDPANLPAQLMAPDPTGMTAGEYASTLMVPPPDPWAPRGALHVFYVLEKNLDLVRRLVDGNAATLTRFARNRKTLEAAAVITTDEAALVAAGADLWSAWLDGWQLGRARPATPEFLKNSEAVSDKFLKAMTEVLEDCAWDGAGLLEALTSKKVKRFQTAKIEQLRLELEDADLLAQGAILTGDALLTHTLDRIAPLLASGQLDMEKVRTLVLTFARLVEK